MEIDRENLRQAVSYFLQTLRKMEEDLAAHKALVLWLRRVPGASGALDRLLTHARESTGLPESVRRRYNDQLESLADHLVDALKIQNGAKKLENLPDHVARNNQFIN